MDSAGLAVSDINCINTLLKNDKDEVFSHSNVKLEGANEITALCLF